MSVCGCCARGESEFMVACDSCDEWFHYECVRLTESQVARIKYFYCEKCEDEKALVTLWKARKPTVSERIDKLKN